MKAVKDRIYYYFKNTDRWLWLACLIVSGVGLVLLRGILDSGYAATLYISSRNLAVQAAAIGMGVLAALVISNINYNRFKKAWVAHVPVTYGLVLLTFFIGVGAAARPEDKRWLVVPGINVWIQPAELLKISFILVFAYHIFCLGDSLNKPRNILLLGLHAAVPVALIHFQGDDGTALLIGTIAVTMLFMAGMNWMYLAGAAVAGTASLPIVWHYIMNDFQRQRILTLLNQEDADPLGWFYQQYQSQIAIAMGGETGVGLMDANHVYVPEMHTDFIFSFLCESFGFMGALGVLCVMIFLCFKLLYNSSRAHDQYGTLICAGVFAMILFQFAVNVGMCLSMIPVIGNPFPFLSYGGSSMLTNFLGIGLAQSVYMYHKSGMFSGA